MKRIDLRGTPWKSIPASGIVIGGDVNLYSAAGVLKTDDVFQSAGIGNISPSWSVVTASRSAGTSYQNTSAKDLELIISISGLASGKLFAFLQISPDNSVWYTVENTTIDVNATATNHGVVFHGKVPPSWYYKLTVTTGSFTYWAEAYL